MRTGRGAPMPTECLDRSTAMLQDLKPILADPDRLARHIHRASCGWRPLATGSLWPHDNSKFHFGFAGCRIRSRIVWRFDLSST